MISFLTVGPLAVAIYNCRCYVMCRHRTILHGAPVRPGMTAREAWAIITEGLAG